MTRLRHERRSRRLSQATLGGAIKIPQPTLSQIERGRLVPTDEQLAKLAAYFNLEPRELLKEIVVVEVRT